MARLVTPWRRLNHWAPHPRCGWIGRHVDMHQLTPAMGDEYQHEQRLERQCRHGQKISRPEVMRVVAQEGAPCLARRMLWSTPAITPNRAMADHDAQLQQFASDPLGTPQLVGARHGRGQVPHLGAEMRTAAARAGLPPPERAPALAMPAHNRVGRDERQMLTPAGTPLARQNPHELVPGAEPSTRSGASGPSQDGDLVAQQQVLEDKVLAHANRGKDGRQQEPEEFEHILSIVDLRRAGFCLRTTARRWRSGGLSGLQVTAAGLAQSIPSMPVGTPLRRCSMRGGRNSGLTPSWRTRIRRPRGAPTHTCFRNASRWRGESRRWVESL